MSTWGDDPFALDPSFVDDPTQALGSEAFTGGRPAERAPGQRRTRLLGGAAILAALVALVLGFAEAGWAALLVGAVGYVMAVLADLRLRRIRRSRRLYTRPWSTAGLRLAVFAVAVVAAWFAAAGLVS